MKGNRLLQYRMMQGVSGKNCLRMWLNVKFDTKVPKITIKGSLHVNPGVSSYPPDFLQISFIKLSSLPKRICGQSVILAFLLASQTRLIVKEESRRLVGDEVSERREEGIPKEHLGSKSRDSRPIELGGGPPAWRKWGFLDLKVQSLSATRISPRTSCHPRCGEMVEWVEE